MVAWLTARPASLIASVPPASPESPATTGADRSRALGSGSLEPPGTMRDADML